MTLPALTDFGTGASYANQQGLLKAMQMNITMIANQRRKTRDLFQDPKRQFGGRYWQMAAHMEGGAGKAGYRPAGQMLPPGTAEAWASAYCYDRFGYSTILYDSVIREHSKGNAMAFADVIMTETENATSWLIDQQNADIYGDGWGILGIITTAVAAATYTVASPATIVLTSATNALWIRPGIRFDVYSNDFRTSAAPTKRNAAGARGGMQVITWDPTTLTMTASGTTALTVLGDFMVREDICGPAGTLFGDSARQSGTLGGAGCALSGLDLMTDDGSIALSYQGVSRTTYPEYKAIRLANGGVARPLTEFLMQKLEDDIAIKGRGRRPDTWISDYGQRQNVLALWRPDVRYDAESVNLGFKSSIKFNGRELVVDEYCQPGRMYNLLKANNIYWFEVKPMGPLDPNDAINKTRVPAFDLFESVIAQFGNLGCDEPQSTGKLLDLTIPS